MAKNAFLPIVDLGRGNQSNSVSKWPFITFGDSWKEVFRNFSQRVKQDVQKKKQLLAGISRVPSSHMAERCVISNQANGNKMVRGNAEGTHSITLDSTLYTSPKSREAAC